MNEPQTGWFVQDSKGVARGPFATELVFELWRQGKLPANPLCCPENSDRWQAMDQVEPFASAMRELKARLQLVSCSCPHCGSSILVAPANVGKLAICKSCNKTIMLRAQTAAPAHRPQPSPPVHQTPRHDGLTAAPASAPDTAPILLLEETDDSPPTAELPKRAGKSSTVKLICAIVIVFALAGGGAGIYWGKFHKSAAPDKTETPANKSADKTAGVKTPRKSPANSPEIAPSVSSSGRRTDGSPAEKTESSTPAAQSAKPAWIAGIAPGGANAKALLAKLAVPAEQDDAMKAIIALGPQASGAAPELLDMLSKATSDSQRDNLKQILIAIEPSANTIAAGLKDANPAVRQFCAELALRRGLEFRELAGAFIEAAADSVPAVRQAALRALAITALPSPAVLEAVSRGLNDADKNVRETAAMTIGLIGKPADSLVPELVRVFNDKKVNRSAMWALGQFGSQSAAALPRLIACVEGKDSVHGTDWMKITFSHEAIGAMGPQAKQAVPAILACSEDCYGSREWAMLQISPAGLDAVIAELDPTRGVIANDRALALLAKMAPGSRRAIPLLIGMLDNPDPERRAKAAETLGAFGPEALPAIGKLIEQLNYKNPTKPFPAAGARYTAAEALGKIGPKASAAVPALLAIVKDETFATGSEKSHADNLRNAAMLALGQISSSPEVIQTLRDYIRKNMDMGTALDALAGIGAPAVPTVLDMLNAGDDRSRNAGLRIAGKIGPPASAATPLLVKMLNPTGNNKDISLILAAIAPESRAAAEPLARLAKTTAIEPTVIAEAALLVSLDKGDPRLLVYKMENDQGVPEELLRGLADAGPGAAIVVNDLHNMVWRYKENKDCYRRTLLAVQAMGRLDASVGRKLYPSLLLALESRYLCIRQAAIAGIHSLQIAQRKQLGLSAP